MIDFNEFIQIAGIIDLAEAEMLQDAGVKYLGFPLRLPVNKEDLTEEEAAEIIGSLHSPFYGVIITYLNKADEIDKFCREMNCRIVQLHGSIDAAELRRLKRLNPELAVIKSLVIKDDNLRTLEEIIRSSSEFTDAFITDTYDPKTGASGATGKTHNWEISKNFVEISPKPVILAGGLNPGNVRDAILKVRPAGVDAHTGVESADGRKDKSLVEKFVAEAKLGFDSIRHS